MYRFWKKPLPGMTEVDNPGAGDCGYYSIEIALIPMMLRELQNVAIPEHPDPKYKKNIFIQKTTPLLFNMYKEICQGKIHGGYYGELEILPEKERLIQEQQLFLNWVRALKNLRNIKEITDQTKATTLVLTNGVRFLRKLLASIRIDRITHEFPFGILGTIPHNLSKLDEEEKKSKETLQPLETQRSKLISELPKPTGDTHGLLLILTSPWDTARMQQKIHQLRLLIEINKRISDLRPKKPEDYEILSELQKKREELAHLVPQGYEQDLTNIKNLVALDKLIAEEEENRLPKLREERAKLIKTIKNLEVYETLAQLIDLDKKISIEEPVAKRTDAEKRVTAFRVSCSELNDTGLNIGILSVLLKQMHLEYEDNDFISNPDINDFAIDFLKWWRAQHYGNLPFENTDQFYELQMTYIACLYGGIIFQGNRSEVIIKEAETWWTQKPPTLSSLSIVRKVSNSVRTMGIWASETDLSSLAQFFNSDLKLLYRAGIPIPTHYYDQNKPTFIIQHRRDHWTTRIPFEDGVQFPQTAEETARFLISQLDILASLENVKNNQNKVSELTKLRSILAPPSVLPQEKITHDQLVTRLIEFKKAFGQTLPTLKQGMHKHSYRTLRRIINFLFGWFIKVDPLVDKAVIHNIMDRTGAHPPPEPSQQPLLGAPT